MYFLEKYKIRLSALSYWMIHWDVCIQTLTLIVLFNVKTLSSHLMLVLMHTKTLAKTFLMLTGVMKRARTPQSSQWLTIQWKRLKYKLFYCFTPHGVKWKWDEFRRHSLVCFRWKHNAALESETEVTAQWEYHQYSFITLPFFPKKVWRSCVLLSLAFSMLCVVPFYCPAVIQLCKPDV